MLFTADFGRPKGEVNEDDEDTMKLSSLADIIKKLAKEATGMRRKEPCSLFLYAASIPNTGLSYFAGRNYTVGEVILEDFLTLPFGINKNRYATPSALVLKHHPILFNVQGVLHHDNENKIASPFQLRVSKAITYGDEIFVEYDSTLHDASPFAHVPTISDYIKTKEIVVDALRSVSDQSHRNGRVICRMAPVMRFVKQTVKRYDPIVAALLPETQNRANHHRTLPPSVATLRNATLLKLQQMGVCLDDIQPKDRQDNENNFAVVQHSISKGNVVTVVPLYIMFTNTESSSSASSSQTCHAEQDCAVESRYTNHCFFNDTMTYVLFCPLGPTIGRVRSEIENNNDLVNVEYRWSRHYIASHFVMHESFKYSTAVMAWDVIALSDLVIGEKVRYIPSHLFLCR
jgi:hypothetical protein